MLSHKGFVEKEKDEARFRHENLSNPSFVQDEVTFISKEEQVLVHRVKNPQTFLLSALCETSSDPEVRPFGWNFT